MPIYIILIMISYWPWHLTPACSGSFAILAAAHRLNEPNSEPNQLLSASYSLALHRNECYSFERDVFVCKHHIPELLSSAARGVLCCLVCYQASRGLRVNLQSDLFIHCKWDGDRETARDSSKRSKQIEFRTGKNIDCCTGNPSFFKKKIKTPLKTYLRSSDNLEETQIWCRIKLHKEILNTAARLRPLVLKQLVNESKIASILIDNNFENLFFCCLNHLSFNKNVIWRGFLAFCKLKKIQLGNCKSSC